MAVSSKGKVWFLFAQLLILCFQSRWTPLHIALHLGHMAVVRYLLLQGAETNISVAVGTLFTLGC